MTTTPDALGVEIAITTNVAVNPATGKHVVVLGFQSNIMSAQLVVPADMADDVGAKITEGLRLSGEQARLANGGLVVAQSVPHTRS